MQTINQKEIPLSSFFVISLTLFFSITGFVIKNTTILFDENILRAIILGLLIVIYHGFISFGFPMAFEKKWKIRSLFQSSFMTALFFYPIILLPCFSFFFSNELLRSVVLCLGILIWSIYLTVETKNTNRKSSILDFISSLWLVSGLMITLGLKYYDYAKYTITAITTVSTFLDCRYLLTILVLIIFIGQSISDSFSLRLPDIFQIKPFKIVIPEKLSKTFLNVLLYPFVIVPNIVLFLIFSVINILWNILSVISIYSWRFCSNLLTWMYKYFVSEFFLRRLGYSIIIVLIIISSDLISKSTLPIIEYVRSDIDIFDFSLISSILSKVIYLFLTTSMIFLILKYLEIGFDSLLIQLQLKLTYFILYLVIISLTGWVYFLIEKLNILNEYAFPQIGTITVFVTVFIGIITAWFLIAAILKKNLT
jgi:hypothetical protein